MAPQGKTRTSGTRRFADAYNSSLQRADGLHFAKEKFQGVELATAPAFLLGDEMTFHGHREVVFAGFCAWLINSKSKAASRNAIANELATQIARAEKARNRKAVPSYQLLTILRAEYRPLYEIYYRIGGMAALKAAITRSPDIENHRVEARVEIQYLVAMALVWDFHARELSNSPERFGRPTVLKGGPLAGLFQDTDILGSALILARPKSRKGKGASKDRARQKTVVADYWSHHQKAIALLYAAAHIPLSKDERLLNRLLDNKLNYADAKPHVSTWFGYAKYFTDEVLTKVPLRNRAKKVKTGSGSKNGKKALPFPKLKSVDAIKPDLPAFTSDQIAKIESKFAEKAESQRRHK